MLCALRVSLRVAMHTTRSMRKRDSTCGHGKVKGLQGGGCYLTGTSSSSRCATPPTSTLVMLVLTCLPVQKRHMSDMEQRHEGSSDTRPSSSKTKTLARLWRAWPRLGCSWHQSRARTRAASTHEFLA